MINKRRKLRPRRVANNIFTYFLLVFMSVVFPLPVEPTIAIWLPFVADPCFAFEKRKSI